MLKSVEKTGDIDMHTDTISLTCQDNAVMRL